MMTPGRSKENKDWQVLTILISLIFAARRYASAVGRVYDDVIMCPHVRPSQVGSSIETAERIELVFLGTGTSSDLS